MSDAPLRVLHVLAELRASGAETMLRVGAPHFRERGIAGQILSIGPHRGSYAPALEAAGYPIHHVPLHPAPRFFPSLFRLLRGRAFDVVHFHVESASFWTMLTAVASGQRALLRTVHSNFGFTGSLRLRRGTQRRALAALGVRYVTPSLSVASNEERRFGVATQIIPNWYDSEHFRPPSHAERDAARAWLGYTSDDVVLISVGNCHPVKNHQAVLHALARTPAAGRPHYLHVGAEHADGAERELVEALGLGDSVAFVGHLADPRAALWAADVFVMPSRFEGFSVAAIEALAVGLPGIFFDAPGLRDLREPFPNLAFVRDVDELAAAIGALRDKRLVATRHAETARERFGCEAGVEAYCALYRELRAS